MAAPPHPPAPEDSDDVTIADEEWPVAEQYRVEPRPRSAEEDDGTIVIQQDNVPQEPVRRFPPNLGPGLLLAALGVLLIVVLVPAGFWLAGRDDDESAASPPTDTVGTTTATTTTRTTPAANTVPELTGLARPGDRDRPLVAARGNGRQPGSRAGRGRRSEDDRLARGRRPARSGHDRGSTTRRAESG